MSQRTLSKRSSVMKCLKSRTLADAFMATQSRMGAKGLRQSSITMQVLTQDATNSLRARAQFCLGQLLRCLTVHRVSLNPETLTEATAILKDTIETEAQMVRGRLFQSAAFAWAGAETARQQLQIQFDQEGPRLITRLTTELNLAAAASAPQQGMPSQGGPSLTFNGPVGLVQTGDGSQATVHQHLNSGVKSEIVAALGALLEQLDKTESRSIGNRTQLRELVVDAKLEAEKADSNPLKLGSSLRTIAETTRFVGSLGPAYQVMKPLLSYFGIHLP